MKVWRTHIVGCGGIGGPFAIQASKILCWHPSADPMLWLYDGDDYEERNRERQMVFRGGVNENKAVNLMALLEAFGHKHHLLRYLSKFIENEDHFAGFLAEGSNDHEDEWQVVCLCLDNDASRKYVYDAVKEVSANVLVIDMANELHDGDVITYARERRGVFATEHPFNIFPQLRNPMDRPPQAYCQEEAPKHPQLVTTNTMASVIGARILWDFLEGNKVPQQVNFNLEKMRVRVEA